MVSLLSKIYGLGTDVRNALYDRGILGSHSLGVKTISIGNITTGGTGKTPLVAHVAEILADAGEKVCVLTRGYGRDNRRDRVLVSDGGSVLADARIGGDEPVELANKLLGKAVVVADADRVSAAAWAKEKFGVTAFVLDDGFQHRRVARDLDIVCIDATDPDSGGRILPAGRLRERFSNISRADVIVITRADLLATTGDIVDVVKERNARAPVFRAHSQTKTLTALDEYPGDRHASRGWSALAGAGEVLGGNELRVMAFCGLANPDPFFLQVQGGFDDNSMKGEFDLASVRKFPDHHRYSQSDIDSIEADAREIGIQALITTAKDAVKLRGLKFRLPCFVLQVDVSISDPGRFRDLLLSV